MGESTIDETARELFKAGWSVEAVRAELQGTILDCGDAPTCSAVEEAMARALPVMGLRGCHAMTTAPSTTSRRGKKRFCAQKAIVEYGGYGYCWYHNPKDPHRFGQGYRPVR